MHVTLRYLAAAAIGLLVLAYLVALVLRKIPSDARIDFPAIILALVAVGAMAFLLSARWSVMVRDALTRVRVFQFANLKVELDDLRAQQEDQMSRLELISLFLPLVLSDPERRHLRNLHRGTTTGYVGNHEVRTELRRLRYLELVTNSRPVASAADGSNFDLKDLVQLTSLGTKWARQIEDMEKPR